MQAKMIGRERALSPTNDHTSDHIRNRTSSAQGQSPLREDHLSGLSASDVAIHQTVPQHKVKARVQSLMVISASCIRWGMQGYAGVGVVS